MISIITNATKKDYFRLKYFIPSLIDVFDNVILEIIIIIDQGSEEGRISLQHNDKNNFIEIDEHSLKDIISLDHRIKIKYLDEEALDQISLKWFDKKNINKCQGGTPIFAFLYGIDQANSKFIFRSDCDMIFYDNGFISQAIKKLTKYHIVQPPLLAKRSIINFTTRAFFLNSELIENALPLKLVELDILRKVHRKLLGRNTSHSLEENIEFNAKIKKISIFYQNSNFGNSMHIAKREEFLDSNIEKIIQNFSKGNIPQSQLDFIDNYNNIFWKGI